MLCIGLSALVVQIPDAETRNWDLETLRGRELEAFQTVRVKGIEKVEDNWMGIDLLSWLSGQCGFYWHELEFISVDGHSLKLHRADLELKPVWLALKDSRGWLEEGIRLVFPGQRDNIWIRGLDKIIMHGFTPVPAPRRIYNWEDIKLPRDESGITDIADLISGFFAESRGELLFVSQDMRPVVLRYPEHLSSAFVASSEGLLFLRSVGLPVSLLPNPLVYIQMGHQAIILPQSLHLLPELAKLLSWPDQLEWQSVRPHYEQYRPGDQLPRDSWLERN